MKNTVVQTNIVESVLIIRLNSPENLNSLTTEMRSQLGEAVELAEHDTSVRSVFLTAEGKSFCSGGDLKMLQQASQPWTVHRRFRNLRQWLIPLISLEKPVVVGARGHAVGGGMGLALSSDLLVAGESLKLTAGFLRLGVVPDIGMMYHLPRLIGMAQAKNFLFNNGTFTAEQALNLGLVSKIVPDDQVEEAGFAEALRLAQGPAEVMGLAKTLMARSFETSMHEMFAYEGFGQVLAMSNPEFHEGLSAALEKRKPDFVSAAQRSK